MTALLAVVVVFVVGWFAVGSIWNVRKGSATLEWLRQALPALGEKTTLRWLGTTSVEMVLSRARPPFESATLVIFLEPRDVPWLWALSRSRGRRDALIFRARTRQAPVHDLEAFDPRSWPAREARRRIATEEWPDREPVDASGLKVFTRADGDLPFARALLEIAPEGGMNVRRLSVREADPHLAIYVDLPGAPTPAAPFFGALRAIGERAMKP